ncbi:MAG: TIGR03960 family B12-binding radical SAM protein [Candidatus Latescibacteria bacterium]|nr:TIGR03960 family B12-binding radical SAM protein [Candidatus Latescibacterota bacterium]NIM66285.1 TIGR03960 family B12-binding radical SAM protein [Candidatus Latescibacterota bacterium]NIO02766.1 TIGR03960 family B12-binding radical SAM protein [Candidatus Latescibacterota bacterium]NIO29901.1 TIGR03960 family B12-binding radical SAM protein [Candidatus Latescibacterota bacterium]NIO57515.1 TIGR03960 family B12-binding radical SAM protein [Candidatus Latescibacterota bacterium]
MSRSFQDKVLSEILPRVQKPGQYAGGEWNVIVKDPTSVDLRFALAFPDTYAIGMSHLGLKILYHMINAREDVSAERVFAPWTDMEEELRKRTLPLFSLESFTPLSDFDVIGFSMQYELCFTNVLNMLELGGVPLLASDRALGDPIVLAGGSLSLAMEPMAPFFDAVLVGDAEDVLGDILDAIIDWKRSSLPRRALQEKLAHLPGIYIPSFYEVSYRDDGTIARIRNIEPAPAKVRKTTTADIENAPFPTRPIVPNVEVVHDRINIEIMRGCPNLCRFCQAVQHYRPVKYRSIEKILSLCEETYSNTGYEEISLTSLSTADYPGIENLIAAIDYQFNSRKVNVSLPSLRVGEQLRKLPNLTSSVRKAGLTMAPEAATDRLREVIGKPIRNIDLLEGCAAAYRAGYRLIKFYFLIGCPTETEADLKALVDLINEASLLRKKISGKRAQINASISSHIPKPHTPFQWEKMNTREELWAKQEYLLSRKKSSQLRFKFHDVDVSYLEAVFSRGDRRLAAALLKARERGIRMDAWRECFDIQAWEEVFRETNLDPDFYALRGRKTDEVLPWNMIELEIPSSYLLKEKARALKSVSAP